MLRLHGLLGFPNLGYAHVEGIEWLPNIADIEVCRTVDVDGDHFSFLVHNFDISGENWTLEGNFDTIILLETLEHVNHDPSGVVTQIANRLISNGVLVASVPNGLSYKTLQEVLTGAPPWTYWFFHPDLRHEPRHAFEYTPVFFKAILRAAGLKEHAFRTICAYADRAALDDMFAIGAALSIPSNMFGETMIAQARKAPNVATIRFPDLIYDADGYYRTTYPALLPRLKIATAHLSFILNAADNASREVAALQAHIDQYACQVDAERSAADSALARANTAEQSVLRLTAENEALTQQTASALMLIDAYMKIADDVARGAPARSLFSRWFFAANGRPRKVLRKLLFHYSGRPRSTFRFLVLKSNGYPRKPFQRWLTSDAYRMLPGAISLPAHRLKNRMHAAAAVPPKTLTTGGRDRSWLNRLLFRPDGRPIKPLRWALFHSNGKPRGLFRRIVLKKNGTIRPAFRYRMLHKCSR